MAVRLPEEYSRDQEHAEKMAGYLAKEYFDVKILAFVLIDIVKAEDKDRIVESLKKLLASGDIGKWDLEDIVGRFPDTSKTGQVTLSSNLGTLVNAKKMKKHAGLAMDPKEAHYFRFPMFAYLDLPDPIEAIEINAMQLVDFTYCITYACFIDKSYYNIGIRDSYLRIGDPVSDTSAPPEEQFRSRISRLGKAEPTMRNYEEEASRFLSNHISGIFLNDKYASNKPCPSIRILSTKSIDLDNTEQWMWDHIRYLNYLRMNIPPYCKFGNALLTYQEDPLFPNSTMTKGITILRAEEGTELKDGDDINKTLAHNTVYFATNLAQYLFVYYWLFFHSRITEEEWGKGIASLRKSSSSSIETDNLDMVKERTNTIIQFYARFMTFATAEKGNIRKLLEAFESYVKNNFKAPVTDQSRHQIDIFDDIGRGSRNNRKRKVLPLTK